MSLPFVDPPASLCLLRLSALGDVTHIVPIVRTLQTHWPRTRLTWIVGAREAQLVGDIPDVEFITFDKRAGLRAYRALRANLRQRCFDALLLMQVALRANLASWCVPAPLRLGFDRARAKDLHALFINHQIPAAPGQHVVDGFFSFLETLGLKARKLRWDIPIPAAARAFAEEQLPHDKPALVISPCSSHKQRNWRPERYAMIADYAVEHYGMRVALCGGPSLFEHKYGEAIARHMHHAPLNLIGKDTIKKLLALLARAEALVCPDSGPAHLATCVGTPVVGLYAATNPQRSGPYLSRQWCVDRYDAAARRYAGKSAAALQWGTKLEFPGVMDLIETDAVIERLDALMSAACR
jgi:heptosyltransferase I